MTSQRCLLLVCLSAVLPTSLPATETSPARTAATRGPRALQITADGRQLVVANRVGTVSMIDTAKREVVSESRIGDHLSDMVLVGEGKLAAVDDEANQLILAKLGADGRWRVEARHPVAADPVSLSLSADGQRVFIASRWSRRVTICRLDPRPKTERVIDTPLAPRAQRLLPDGKTLLVADAFGGRLALIDVELGKLRRVLPLNGHQIRRITLARDSNSLLIPHQLLRGERATTHDGVHWGGVMSNLIRRLPIAELLDEKTKRIGIVGVFYLGHPGRAFGDPHQLAETRDGRQIVTFSGVNEVGVSDAGANYFRAVKVGARPTSLVLDARERFAYAANEFDDTISVIDVDGVSEAARIELGPRRELTFAEKGKRLFYNARLSVDGWYSCNSCHVDGHTNGQLNDNLSDDSFGAPKRVISLLGTEQTRPWAWDGEAVIFESQVESSIVKTMRGKEPSVEQVQAISAFVLSLRAAPSVDRLRGGIDQPSLARGKKLFAKLGCAECHQPPTYTSDAVYDVGVRDENGRTEFNPPSLRGVSQRARLFHDNRAASLKAVFEKHRHNLEKPLSKRELKDLLTFLRSL